MSWSSASRKTILGGALAALAACGFQPVYGPDTSASALRGAVAISAPESVGGYHMLTALEERLGIPSDARWQLHVTISTGQSATAVASDGTISRYSLTGQSAYNLTEIATGVTITSGTVEGLTGYGSGGNTVAVRAAQQDALLRMAEILADRIVTRLNTVALP